MLDAYARETVPDDRLGGDSRPPASAPGASLRFRATFFRGAGATEKQEGEWTLAALRDRILATTAETKDRLPWLKLARFGEARTPDRSLRHNANVLAITGVEADYDGEEMPLEEAVERLRAAGVLSMVYASPRHAEDAPRWRVLCPTSTELPPEARGKLMGRLNGLFGGVFDRASWTLSQSYYFGAIRVNPSHRAEVIEGTPIDLLDGLDAGSIGKPSRPAPQASTSQSRPRRAAWDGGEGTPYGLAGLARECEALRRAEDGEKHHTLNRAAYSIGGLVAAGQVAEGFAFRALRNALRDMHARAPCEDFDAAERTLERAFEDGIAAPRQPPPERERRPKREEPPPHDDAPEWHRARPAEEPEEEPGQEEAQREAEEPRQEEERPKAKPRDPNVFGRLRVLSVEDALDAPPREYLLDGLIAPGEFSVWWGAPKCGKSFLLLRIAYGMAQGLGLWGREAVAVPVCYVAAEGGHGIKGRIHALRKRLGPAPDFHFIAQAVDLFDPEADLDDLIAAIAAFGSRFVVLDTLARVMGGGDENQTRDMNAFVRNCLRIQEEAGAHVAVVHHGGWDGSHARGSIALIGAADIVVKVSGEKGGPKTAFVEYAKDDDSDYSLGFGLTEEDLPPDAKGRARKTFIAEETEPPPEAPEDRRRSLSTEERGWLGDIEALFALPDRASEDVQPVPDMKPVRAVTREGLRVWLQQRGRLSVTPSVTGGVTLSGTERMRLLRMLNRLKDKGKLGLTDHWVWLL